MGENAWWKISQTWGNEKNIMYFVRIMTRINVSRFI